MIDRLAIVKQRFDSFGFDNSTRYHRRPKTLCRSQSGVQRFERLDGKTNCILNLTQRQQEAEEIISDGSDPEMTDMAKRLEEVKSKLPELEETIRFMLIPKDPEDAKNIVMELRAGTGGDEASILLETCIGCTPNTAKARGGK